jgi:hypothetical protein
VDFLSLILGMTDKKRRLGHLHPSPMQIVGSIPCPVGVSMQHDQMGLCREASKEPRALSKIEMARRNQAGHNGELFKMVSRFPFPVYPIGWFRVAKSHDLRRGQLKWFCRDNGGRPSLIDIIRTAYITSE